MDRSGTPEAVVFDLDGTLVRLLVDWQKVHREVKAVYADAGVTVPEATLFDLVEQAQANGIQESVEAVVREYEIAGAKQSDPLPPADELSAIDVPIGICSLNASVACQTALETHDLETHIDTIVGRDTVGPMKPHSKPLETVLKRLAVPPERAVFIGDSQRDATTANRANVSFHWVNEW